MKAVNIILSILILILALASAVMSYFLFEKRDTLTKGWDKMAAAINLASTALDDQSGTKEAAKLTTSELSLEKYAEMDAKLQQFVSQSRRIAAERNDLADALYAIGQSLKIGNIGDKAEFRALATYKANRNAVVRGVSDTLERRDSVYRALADDVSGLGVNVSPDKLAENGRSAYSPVSEAIRNMLARKEYYDRNVGLMGSYVNVRASDFSNGNYREEVNKVKRGVEKASRDLLEMGNTLDKVRSEVIALNSKIKSRDIDIENLNKLVGEKDYTINSYKSALGVAEEAEPPQPWFPGSKEARENTVGEVVKVSSDYGYIAVNLGSDTKVKQTLGKHVFEVDPQIEKGMEMVVARGRLGEGARFVARVKLDEVGKDCSTANIPAGSEAIKVGDIVYFDKAQLK